MKKDMGKVWGKQMTQREKMEVPPIQKDGISYWSKCRNLIEQSANRQLSVPPDIA